VSRTIRRLAARDELDTKKVEYLMQSFAVYEENLEGMALCLSEEPDLLSQWRGYAEDASGVCIGFSTAYLDLLAKKMGGPALPSFHRCPVLYTEQEHEKRLRPHYEVTKAEMARGTFDPPVDDFMSAVYGITGSALQQQKAERAINVKRAPDVLAKLSSDMYQLKGSGYREEKEWRLLSHALASEDFMKFRVAGRKIVPYRTIDLLDIPGVQPITEIRLGPKHGTPLLTVDAFLEVSRFPGVRVIPSSLTYR
jgi:Protein of unknown function (DUF2971)